MHLDCPVSSQSRYTGRHLDARDMDHVLGCSQLWPSARSGPVIQIELLNPDSTREANDETAVNWARCSGRSLTYSYLFPASNSGAGRSSAHYGSLGSHAHGHGGECTGESRSGNDC